MHLPHMLWASVVPAAWHLPLEVQRASFSIPDTLFLVVIALIVFGPKKLPEISRQLGKLLFEFRRASNDFKLQIEEELRLAEQAERQKELVAQATTPEPATPVAISAEETVAAAPGIPEGEANSIMPPGNGPVTIRPPATGETVSAARPGYAASFERAPESAPPEQGATPDEMLAAAREAGDTQSALAQPSDAEVFSPGGEAAPVHHA